MSLERNSQESPGVKGPLMSGLIHSITLSLILSLAITLLLFATNLSSSLLSTLAASAFVLSAFYGSLVAARKAGSRGLIYGLINASLFLLVSWLLSLFIGGGSEESMGWLSKTLYGVGAGSLGGMVGVAFAPGR